MTSKSARGNQHSYTPEQVAHFKAEVLEKLPQGWTLRQIFEQDGMCSMRHFFQTVLPGDESFVQQYARAFELRNEYWAEDMVEIADDARNDWMETRYGPKFNKDAAERSKLRIETRKWLMGKSQPKKYGDKVELKHSGDADAPAVFTLKIDNG